MGKHYPVLCPRLLQETSPKFPEGRNKRQLVQLNEQSSPSPYLSPTRKANTKKTCKFIKTLFIDFLLTGATKVKNIPNILGGGLNVYCLAPRLLKTVT